LIEVSVHYGDVDRALPVLKKNNSKGRKRVENEKTIS
jgi:hypothetical protein